MAADDAFYPPQGYAAAWPLLGLLLVVASLGWLVYVWRSTRPPRPAGAVAVAPTLPVVGAVQLALAKRESLARIDELVAEVAAGRLDERAAHQQLSQVVREFVDQRSGAGASTMTLSDLDLAEPRLEPLAELVERLYPGEFAPEPAPALGPVAEQAKAVIAGWT